MIPARVILWIMLFLSITCNMFNMNNLNIAIVSMVKYDETTTATIGAADTISLNSTNNTLQRVICKREDFISVNNTSPNVDINKLRRGEFEWTKHEQNLILGAFYLLQWIAQFVGGVLSHKYGTKIVVGLSTLIACVLSSFVPPLSYIDPILVVILRIVQGFVNSIGFPAALYAIMGPWCPPHERGKFITVFLGTSFGIAIGYPVFGYVADTIGWQYIFHLTSLCGVLWYLGWQYLVYDTPDDHPRISQTERSYIKTRLGKTASRDKLPVPWKAILTSMPFIVNIICQFGVTWGRVTVSIYQPTYFKVIHGLNSAENGLVSGLPHFFKSVLSYLSGVVTDILLAKSLMSKTGVRNLSTFVSSVLCGLMLIGVSYANCDLNLATIFMALCIVLNACFMTGASVALVDMSPNFCSILQGVCGTIGAFSGFLSPMLVSYMANIYENDRLEQWKMIWLVTGAIYVIPGIIFVLFSDSELQSWNSPEKLSREELLEKEKNGTR